MWTIDCYLSEDKALGLNIGWIGEDAGLFIRYFGYELFIGFKDTDEMDGCGGNASA